VKGTRGELLDRLAEAIESVTTAHSPGRDCGMLSGAVIVPVPEWDACPAR
jgi:hypothetical protein